MFQEDVTMNICLVNGDECVGSFRMGTHFFPWCNGWIKILKRHLNDIYGFGGDLKIRDIIESIGADTIYVSYEYNDILFTAERIYDFYE